MNESYKDNMEVEFELVMGKISNDRLAKSLGNQYITRYEIPVLWSILSNYFVKMKRNIRQMFEGNISFFF